MFMFSACGYFLTSTSYTSVFIVQSIKQIGINSLMVAVVKIISAIRNFDLI